jgi:hypothetical protein
LGPKGFVLNQQAQFAPKDALTRTVRGPLGPNRAQTRTLKFSY